MLINKMWLGGITAAATDSKMIITGAVTDAEGVAVANATVQVKGTGKATLTDADGIYQLKDVGEYSFLKISAVGYCTSEIRASRSGNQVCMLKMEVMGEVVVVGLIRSDYDDNPPAAPTHVAVIEVSDNITSQPLKAKITIGNNELVEQVIGNTNKNGVYKLRSIKEQDNYKITISAEGYKDSIVNIEGWKFNKRKETSYVFLNRNEAQAPEKRQIILGGMRSSWKEPLYILDGELTNAEILKNITPEEIERIDVLKGEPALALYGSPAEAGVVLITTKKHPAKKYLPAFTGNKKSTTIPKGTTSSSTIENLSISPNPLEKGNSLTISFTSKSAGDYRLQILNSLGAVLQTKEISVTQKQHVLQLQTNASWAAGIYYVTVSGVNNNAMQAGKFIIK